MTQKIDQISQGNFISLMRAAGQEGLPQESSVRIQKDSHTHKSRRRKSTGVSRANVNSTLLVIDTN